MSVHHEGPFYSDDDPQMKAWHAAMLAGKLSIIGFERRKWLGLEEAERLEALDREARRARRAQKAGS